MNNTPPTIAVLGASGLIGEAVASQLSREGFSIVPVARRFNPAQKAAFGSTAVEVPIVAFSASGLGKTFAAYNVDIVVNCLGVLQDGPRGKTDMVHRAFVEQLVLALRASDRPRLLIQLSIPGTGKDDHTPFSRTKREAEQTIASASIPFVVLRPGFVIAPAAHGGSALIRALAALPFEFPARDLTRPFATTDVGDIARTVAVVARRWMNGERDWAAAWQVMAHEPSSLGEVMDAFQRHLGGPRFRIPIPAWLMNLGARAGDLVAHLGWSPPMRTTALVEMRRGVAGDPRPWIAATGIDPASLDDALRGLRASIQEKWFARLYLAKVLVLASLVVFWAVSGLIALTVAFNAAAAILVAAGFSPSLAQAMTLVSGAADIAVGLGIAYRKTCRLALVSGIFLALSYMIAAALLTPALWIEPLGALVKTGPAIVLMLVALAIIDDR